MKTWRETIISIHADNARVFASVPPLCRHRSTSCPRRGLRLSLRLFSPSPPPFPILETPIPRFLILDRVEFVENYWLKMGRAILNFHPSWSSLWNGLPFHPRHILQNSNSNFYDSFNQPRTSPVELPHISHSSIRVSHDPRTRFLVEPARGSIRKVEIRRIPGPRSPRHDNSATSATHANGYTEIVSQPWLKASTYACIYARPRIFARF